MSVVKLICAYLFVGVAASATAGQVTSPGFRRAVLPGTPAGWSAAAVADVEATYRLLNDEHPGMLDPANPGFARQLARARTDALVLARMVRDAAGYSATLGAFQADLRDGHAGPFDNLPEGALPAARWPGFVTVWRGDGLYVFASEAGGPTRGTKLLACDGRSITDLVRRNVFRFEGRPDEPGQWWQRAPHLMLDTGNPFVSPPRRCTVEQEGHRRRISLAWRPVTSEAATWRADAYNGDTLPVGASQPRPGLFWIAMPTFDPDAADVERYDALYATMDRRLPAQLAARAIVLDLRHNQGGSSDWSFRVAQRLWGKGAVAAAMDRYAGSERVRWRATRGNLAAVREEAESTRQDGDPDGARERTLVAQGLEQALRAGRSVFDQPTDASDPFPSPSASGPALHAPVYVIVPGQCASACLDALDVFTRFPNVSLIGAPSSGDTTYIDVRKQPLPSGLGLVIMPMKTFIGRPRASGQVYRPRIVVSAISWSTSAFADAIEQDQENKQPISE